MDAVRFGLRAFVAIFPIVNPFSPAILNFFSITRPALVLAAAVLVCRSGWRALAVTDRISPEAREEGLLKEDVSLTPIGMPMLAGPGAISVAIGLSADASGVAKNTGGIVAILLV